MRPGPEEPRAHIIGGSGGIPNGRHSRRNHEPLWNSEEEHLLAEPRQHSSVEKTFETATQTNERHFDFLGDVSRRKPGKGTEDPAPIPRKYAYQELPAAAEELVGVGAEAEDTKYQDYLWHCGAREDWHTLYCDGNHFFCVCGYYL